MGHSAGAYNGWDGSSTTGEALGRWRDTVRECELDTRTVVVPDARITVRKSPADTIAASHGCFDNSLAVVGSTLELITGAELALPVDDLQGF